jgi:hypothetical protein
MAEMADPLLTEVGRGGHLLYTFAKLVGTGQSNE